ncbi:MAG: hypothetical protein LBC03_00590 [Nitrososphaerota archaeon]|jgi:hypothetical protein|nr:hypothetical protein [Nitrososphaerota archaeon]
MIKNTHKVTLSVFMMCLCILSMFIPVVAARDAFAPSWLKEGAYVKYEPYIETASNLGNMCFFDVTNSQFAGTNYMLSQPFELVLNTVSSNLMWQCVNVNSTMAKLQVTLDYIGESPSYFDDSGKLVVDLFEEMSIQRTGECYVDLYNRGVYNVDGVFLGTTHLWLPANPSNGQEIIIWEENSEAITVPVTFSDDSWTRTVQGPQDTFSPNRSVTIKNQSHLLMFIYDLDTGLCVSGLLQWDPIFATIGIGFGLIGRVSETNIDLGPERSEITWIQILGYTIIPVTIILIVVTLIIKHKKKKN